MGVGSAWSAATIGNAKPSNGPVGMNSRQSQLKTKTAQSPSSSTVTATAAAAGTLRRLSPAYCLQESPFSASTLRWVSHSGPGGRG